jgi:Family of unknown function (DUF6130)
MLAHAGGAPKTLSVVLLFAGIWVGWAGWSRLKHRGFPRMPVGAAFSLIGLALALVLAAGFVPPLIYGPSNKLKIPVPSGARPSSTATIAIVKPAPGQLVAGDQLEVVMTLTGGQITDATTTKLAPNTGHIHLSVDGTVVSMTYGLVQIIPLNGLAPGVHTLLAEFVAADHGPFAPRVEASLDFQVPATASP